jgi:hypothetical protein
MIEQLGLKAREIPMHPRDGLDLDAMERALRGRRIAACLAVPNFNNPLGSLMPDEHKRRLIEILARRDVPLMRTTSMATSRTTATARASRNHSIATDACFCADRFPRRSRPVIASAGSRLGRYYERVKTLKLTSTLATATLPQLRLRSSSRTAATIIISACCGEISRHSCSAAVKPWPRRFPRASSSRVPPEASFCGSNSRKSSARWNFTSARCPRKSALRRPDVFREAELWNFIRLNCGQPWTSGWRPRSQSSAGW